MLVEGIGELVTNDPELGEGRLGLLRDAAVAVDGDRVVWAGPAGAVPEGVAGPRLDAAGAAVLPGFVDAHTHLVFAGGPDRGVRRPDARRAICGRGDPHDGDGHARRRRRGAADERATPGGRGAPGRHHHARGEVGLRADRLRRGPAAADRRRADRGGHVPRGARRPAGVHRGARRVRGPRLRRDARHVRPARAMVRRVLRPRRVRRGTRPAGSSRPRPPAASGCACTRTSWSTARARASRPRSAPRAPTTSPT